MKKGSWEALTSGFLTRRFDEMSAHDGSLTGSPSPHYFTPERREQISASTKVLLHSAKMNMDCTEKWWSGLEVTPITSSRFLRYCLDQSDADNSDDFRGILQGVNCDSSLLQAFGMKGLYDQAHLDDAFIQRLYSITQVVSHALMFHVFDIVDTDQEALTFVSSRIGELDDLVKSVPNSSVVAFI